jgi:hypothetical protein
MPTKERESVVAALKANGGKLVFSGRAVILLTGGKLRGKIWTHKNSLIPSFFIIELAGYLHFLEYSLISERSGHRILYDSTVQRRQI